MAGYFNNFRTYQYNNHFCKNLLTRSAIARSVVATTSAFYPYDLREGERPDTLSFLYYKKPELEWLLFFANGIIDPYYDWYLSYDQFNSFIKKKYGSVILAQTKTKHFEINWVGDSTRITISAYNNLTANSTVNLKKYWDPIVNEYDQTIAYKRKLLDLTTTTNKIINLSITNLSGTFTLGEDVYQQSNGVITSSASVVAANTTTLTVQHVTENFMSGRTITGVESNATANCASQTLIRQNIPDLELTYWRPVSLYDWETQQNENKKTLKIIGEQYSALAEKNLEQLMG